MSNASSTTTAVSDGGRFLTEESVHQLTDSRFIIPPHVFPYGIEVSFKKVREVIIDLRRSSTSSQLLRKAAEKVGDPPRQRIGRNRGCRGGCGSIAAAAATTTTTAQQVMETVCATICATVPVRAVPETVEQGL